MLERHIPLSKRLKQLLVKINVKDRARDSITFKISISAKVWAGKN